MFKNKMRRWNKVFSEIDAGLVKFIDRINKIIVQ